MSGRLFFARSILFLFSVLLVFSIPLTAGARVWLVRPDGTGDAPTIAAAVDSFSSNDAIELVDGTYLGPGNRDVSNHEKAIVVRSQSGDPTACIIDCQGSETDPHQGFYFYGGG